MSSNSKLTSVQKGERKAMLLDLPRDATFANNGEVTILAVPAGNVTRIFSSVMSEDEIKFRRKVGEYWAMSRYFADYAGMILPGFWTATQVMDGLETQVWE